MLLCGNKKGANPRLGFTLFIAVVINMFRLV